MCKNVEWLSLSIAAICCSRTDEYLNCNSYRSARISIVVLRSSIKLAFPFLPSMLEIPLLIADRRESGKKTFHQGAGKFMDFILPMWWEGRKELRFYGSWLVRMFFFCCCCYQDLSASCEIEIWNPRESYNHKSRKQNNIFWENISRIFSAFLLTLEKISFLHKFLMKSFFFVDSLCIRIYSENVAFTQWNCFFWGGFDTCLRLEFISPYHRSHQLNKHTKKRCLLIYW